MGNKVKLVDFKDGWLIFTVDFWGSEVKIQVVLPDWIKRAIAAEVG